MAEKARQRLECKRRIFKEAKEIERLNAEALQSSGFRIDIRTRSLERVSE